MLLFKERTIWYLGGGGGGARLKFKKKVCRHKSQKKKFVENVSRKKSLLSKLMKNMLTRSVPKLYMILYSRPNYLNLNYVHMVDIIIYIRIIYFIFV